jgi:uncharacterized integral membrane protein
MIEEQEKLIGHSIEEKNKSKETLFRIIGAIISVVVLIILIVIKKNRDSFPLFWFIAGIILIIIFFLLMFFGFTLYRKYQEAFEKKEAEGKLPPAITLEQADQLIKELLVKPNYSDYAVGWLQHRVYVVGEHTKSKVLLVHLVPTPYSTAAFQFIVMNLHYPRELYSYITQKKYNPAELGKIVNALSNDPKDEPDYEKRIETDLASGRQTEYIKRSQHQTEIQKSEKKEDLE